MATAVATIPGPDGTINGCYDAGSTAPHPLAVVDDPASCKQTLLPFNQRGPAGPPGTLGSSSRVIAPLTETAERDFAGTASCPAGRILLGGGFELDTLTEGYNVVTSRPSADVRGWDVTIKRRPGYVSSAEFGAVLRAACSPTTSTPQPRAKRPIAHWPPPSGDSSTSTALAAQR